MASSCETYCQMATNGIYSAIWRLAMLALQPVDTAAPAFRPDPITQDEAAAMFRAVLNLFGKWELTDEHAAPLLDMPVRSYRRWQAEGPGREIGRASCRDRVCPVV